MRLEASRNQLLQTGLLLAILLATTLAYLPSISAPFLLDDHAQLESIQLLESDPPHESLTRYLTANTAGPSGRPLAMLSFLIDDTVWPSAPSRFRLTNLYLHLINSLLLCWLLIMVLRITRPDIADHPWVMGVCALWILSPFHVSTTAYVIQRMTLLATTFVLLALLTYVRARQLQDQRPKAGLALIMGSYALAGVGIFAKESAASFVLLVAVLEFFLLPGSTRNRPLRLIVITPAVALLIWLAAKIPGSVEAAHWLRDFSLGERVLSQFRAVGYYLWRYLVPGVDYLGVLNDGFMHSKSFWKPASTAIWFAVHAVVLVVAWRSRARWPFIAAGIGFFYAGHVLESSVINLELIYEHRNYLPSMLLLLGLLHWRQSRGASLLLGIALLANAVLLHQRASLWKDPIALHAHWAAANPQSERAATSYAGKLYRFGRHDQAVDYLSAFVERASASLQTTLTLLMMKCSIGKDQATDISRVFETIDTKRYRGHQLYTSMIQLSTMLAKRECQEMTFERAQELVDAYLQAFAWKPFDAQPAVSAKALLSLRAGDLEGFELHASDALGLSPNRELTLNLCAAIGTRIGPGEGCSCFENYAPIFANPPANDTLTKALLGYDNLMRSLLERRATAFCGRR